MYRQTRDEKTADLDAKYCSLRRNYRRKYISIFSVHFIWETDFDSNFDVDFDVVYFDVYSTRSFRCRVAMQNHGLWPATSARFAIFCWGSDPPLSFYLLPIPLFPIVLPTTPLSIRDGPRGQCVDLFLAIQKLFCSSWSLWVFQFSTISSL